VLPSFLCYLPRAQLPLIPSSQLSFSHFLVWDLLAFGYQIPTLAPTVLASSTKHPRNVNQKETCNPHTSIESYAASINARRPEGSSGQSSTQAEVFATNTAAPHLPPSSSPQHNQDPHQEIEVQEDQHQDSEDEIEAVIEDELARLRQENECLRFV
jgi:hypothetical protein